MAARDTQGQRHDRIHMASGTGEFDRLSAPKLATRPIDTDISIVQKMLSAVSGSVLTSLLVTPLDVVRVRLQAQSGPSTKPYSIPGIPSFVQLPPDLGVRACCREVFWVQNQSQFCIASPVLSTVALEESVISDCAAEETQRRTFNSTLDGIRKIARNEGVPTLWRGLSPTLAMAIPANVIYFAGYDWLRTSQRSPMFGRVNDTYSPLVAGSAARILAAIVVSPVEMLRTRMQATQAAKDSSGVLRATLSGLNEMVSTEGYRSLWKGLTLTLWRDVPFSALYWWGYEFGRHHLLEARTRAHQINAAPGSRTRRLSRSDQSHRAVLVDSFIAGATSGAIAAFVTTPFDVAKTRQQTLRHDPNAKPGVVRFEDRSMPRFLWHIFRTEGASGLFKGWAARCLKVAPACAIMISSYEIGKKMASGVNEGRGERTEA